MAELLESPFRIPQIHPAIQQRRLPTEVYDTSRSNSANNPNAPERCQEIDTLQGGSVSGDCGRWADRIHGPPCSLRSLFGTNPARSSLQRTNGLDYFEDALDKMPERECRIARLKEVWLT